MEKGKERDRKREMTKKEKENLKQEQEQDKDQNVPEDERREEEMDLKAQLEAKDKELAECKDKMLRLAAELENFKKRVEREKIEHMKYALEEFAKELLPFLDNLERAVASAKDAKDINQLIEGIEFSLAGYLKTLEKFGLKAFAAEGQRFDPNYHEALSVEEREDVDHNTVLQELLKGYTLHEKVLRPALVVVSKKNNKESGQ